MNIYTFATPYEAAEALAQKIVAVAEKSIVLRNRFNFVLTGGSSPKDLYELLATKYRTAINWQKVYFFFGDERYVPASDADYNGLMAQKTLLSHLDILPGQVFFVNTHLSPEVAAADYFERIKTHFDTPNVVFDMVLLGMGNDAHTASLFPQTTILDTSAATVEAVYVAKLESWRISLTAKLINNAREVAFLVFGSGKAEALRHIMAENGNAHDYPSRLIRRDADWYVDEDVKRST